ncbi:MAG: hypothetical protein Q4C98_03740 [Capnocytophaga sp.]|nr:hypothetical protein [Capnocytophaga sp.]
MKPIEFDDIPDEVFIEDILELTESINDEFPQWLTAIEKKLGVNPAHIRFTNFVENTDDETSPIEFAGYFYDVFSQKMYEYQQEKAIFTFWQVDIKTLTIKDTHSLRVLHLLDI